MHNFQTDVRSVRSIQMRFFLSLMMALALMMGGASLAMAADSGSQLSLITETPEDGFQLAVKLSQKAVATVQPDANVRKGLRGNYSQNTKSLIEISGVVAVHFQTVAAANDYWRNK